MIKISEEQISGTSFKLKAEYHGEYAGKLEYQLFVFDAKTSVIADLEVFKRFRNNGIATELLKTAIERIFSRPWMHNILLQDGSKGNITGRIVSKLGFHKVDGKGLYWKISKKNVG